ncbi:glucan biosynthesis protein G [Uliginosibacterium sp. H3]|uniref:Glucans biosynthesis protein G n=1 Tax=Uliginosibacterium silvisoli TaxID=3114758 RepID=A0ABU6K0S0_9RHOO|nr:glucan biosynthesis protein G [Uliginosibacterium sp. H3]
MTRDSRHKARHRARLPLALAILATALVPSLSQAFSFDDVAARAQKLAAESWRSDEGKIPDRLKQLDYDQYRDIRFRPDKALWRDRKLPFEVMFFHVGGFFTAPVHINEVDEKGAHPIRFDRKTFDYGPVTGLTPREEDSWGDVGFAGFRVHYPLNNAAYKDELSVFLGASYFRALGNGQRYGLSARGLAIDTVGGKGEEFPRFKEFWIERPASDAKSLTLYALLDSPSVSGAYRIVMTPGNETMMEVQARLFLRKPVATLGIAPLTSMYQYGENQPLSTSQPGSTNFRPEVHDSDGLSVQTGDGEWIWRPLINPQAPLTTSFSMKTLGGFGLMQRDRAFSNYEDLEARYDLRPSAWVEPVGNWGPGRVELMQLPTPDETNDNIVAYWVPQTAPTPGKPLDLTWRIRMQSAKEQRPPNGWTVQSRSGGGGYTKQADKDERYVVDFAGPAFAALPANAPVEAVVSAVSNAQIVERTVFHNEVTGGWRLAMRIQRTDPTKPAELRAYLKHRNDTLTETWSNVIPPR